MSEIQRAKFVKNALNGVFASSAALTRLPPLAFFSPTSSRKSPTLDNITKATDMPNVLGANPSIDKYTLPALYNAFEEVQALGNVLFPPSEDDPASNLPTDLARLSMTLSASVVAGPKPSSHHPSMLVDMENGRPMEVEHIVGELVRMGHECGVPVPVSDLSLKRSSAVADLYLDLPSIKRLEMLYALLLIVQNQFLRQSQERSLQ